MLGDPKSQDAGSGLGLYWSIEKQIREWEAATGSVVGAHGRTLCGTQEPADADSAGNHFGRRLYPAPDCPQRVAGSVRWTRQSRDSADLGREREFARKVRTLSGNYQLLQLAPWLLTSENPVRFEFVSHKLLRLLIPFALAIVLAGSVVLSGPIYRFALVLQLAFYGLSLLAMTGLKTGLLARLANAAYTFVFLNTAALVAFVNFVTGRKAVWGR